jgi:hypothetical protein
MSRPYENRTPLTARQGTIERFTPERRGRVEPDSMRRTSIERISHLGASERAGSF